MTKISLIPAESPKPGKPLSSRLLEESIASQSQSVLFNRIPGEIRQKIFEYACTSTDIRDEPIQQVALYHRPGYEHYQRVWTDLLRTCRRVYLETYLLPASVNEHVFWCYDGPEKSENRPYNFESSHDYMHYELRIKLQTQEQKNAVQELHLFTQQFWLDMAGYGIGTRKGETAWMVAATSLATQCRPKKIKITIRHRDWWSWDESLSSDERLGIHPFWSKRAMCTDMDRPAREEKSIPWAWGYQFRRFQGLQELEMEFETIDAKSTQLDAVVQRAMAWRFPLSDGKVLTTEDMPVVKSRWHTVGDKYVSFPARVDNTPSATLVQDADPPGFHDVNGPQVHTGFDGSNEDGQPAWQYPFSTEAADRCRYYVVSVRWKARKESVS